MVDELQLLNKVVLHGYGHGDLVYSRGVDKSFLDMLTKMYKPRTN